MYTKARHEKPEGEKKKLLKGMCSPDQGNGATLGVLGYPCSLNVVYTSIVNIVSVVSIVNYRVVNEKTASKK